MTNSELDAALCAALSGYSDESDYYHAAFIVARCRHGFAATTRAADRGEGGRIGLPGGKLDAGETAKVAALREAKEEGWQVFGELTPIHEGFVEGKRVIWYKADAAFILEDYKEKGRIKPVIASRDDILLSGYGNEELPL